MTDINKYVTLIESAEEEEDHSVEEEHLEGDSEEEEEVLTEDGSFWENFEKDTDFELNEVNGMYCVTGLDSQFHYGSHVDYDCAADHAESLRNY